MRQFLSRLLGMLWRRDAELDEEIQTHLDALTEEHSRRGMSRAQSRLAAARAFGGVMQTKERYRDQRGFRIVDVVRQDVRFALRGLQRDQKFALAAILTLGIGIGIATAVFSVLDAVLVRPLPYTSVERIVLLGSRIPNTSATTGEVFHFLRDRVTGFGSLAAYRGRTTGWNAVTGERAEYVHGLAVSKGYFDVFGAQPLVGRAFLAAEDTPNGPPVVVINESLWERYFQRRSDVLGQIMQLGGRPHMIVGVMPAQFRSIPAADVWTPLQLTAGDSALNYTIVGRLSDDNVLDQINAQFEVLKTQMTIDLQGTVKNFPDRIKQMVWMPFQAAVSENGRFTLQLLLGATATLMLIACANVAALQLVRAVSRRREMATRAALGAARGQIISQVVTESIVLGLISSAVGIAVAFLAMHTVLPLVSADFLLGQTVQLDWRVLSAAVSLGLVTSAVSALWPAVAAAGLNVRRAMSEGSRGSTGSRAQTWFRRTFVISQVVAAMVLIVTAGLFLRTLLAASSVELGFDPSRVVVAQTSMQGIASTPAEFYERVLDRIRRLPGVEFAAVGNNIPVERGLNLAVAAAGEIPLPRSVDWRYVTPEYFSALGIVQRAGRTFDRRDDSSSAQVAIVNEAFATAYFHHPQNALGQSITIVSALDSVPRQIVGVSDDVRTSSATGWARGHPLNAPAPPTIYVPAAQVPAPLASLAHGPFPINWIVRTRSGSSDVIPSVEAIMRSEAPTLPVIRFVPMQVIVEQSVQLQHSLWRLFALFAVIALFLAVFGVYGLVSYSVAQRTREIGIAVALGATARKVVGRFVAEGLLVVTTGIAIGCVFAGAAARLMTTMIFGIAPSDPVTFAAAGLLFLVVASIAAIIPARRAARIDPIVALRCE